MRLGSLFLAPFLVAMRGNLRRPIGLGKNRGVKGYGRRGDPCACCAAKWYGEVAREVLQEGPPRQVDVAASATQAVSGQQLFSQLEELMNWRREGLLTDSEFEQFKHRLLQH